MPDEKPSAPERPRLGVKLGGKTLTGPWAVVILVVMLALLVAAFVALKPGLRIALALWLAFIIYWSAAAKDRAPARSTESPASRRLHERLLNLGLLLLFVSVPGLRWRFVPDATWTVVAGLALQAGCALLGVWARRKLGRNWSGAVAINAGQELVRSGPYRLVRHPMYTSMLGQYAGAAIVSGELHALLAVALVVAAYVRKIRLEERTLREHFGAAWDEHRRRTWALIPGVL